MRLHRGRFLVPFVSKIDPHLVKRTRTTSSVMMSSSTTSSSVFTSHATRPSTSAIHKDLLLDEPIRLLHFIVRLLHGVTLDCTYSCSILASFDSLCTLRQFFKIQEADPALASLRFIGVVPQRLKRRTGRTSYLISVSRFGWCKIVSSMVGCDGYRKWIPNEDGTASICRSSSAFKRPVLRPLPTISPKRLTIYTVADIPQVLGERNVWRHLPRYVGHWIPCRRQVPLPEGVALAAHARVAIECTRCDSATLNAFTKITQSV